MSLDRPVIAVIGAGAVGGYYGARLIQHGHNVHLLMRSDLAAIRSGGMRIQSRDGDFTLSPSQINAYDQSTAMPKTDLVVVTIKTTSNHLLKPLISPLLKDDTAILTLQNGLGNEQTLADLFGEQRILGGMAFVCINRTGPGEIVHSDHGMIRLGEYHAGGGAGASERARKIAELFSSSRVPCRVLDDLAAGRWDKLVWNVPFNGLGAVLDMATDRILNSLNGMAVIKQLMREVINSCQPLGVALPASLIEEKIDHTKTMGAYQSSMQIDRRLRRPMEIEAIVGEVLRTAQKHAVATPLLEMLYTMLKAVEAANRPIK